MARTRTWEISDEFWQLVEPLIPTSLRTADKKNIQTPSGRRKKAQVFQSNLLRGHSVYPAHRNHLECPAQRKVRRLGLVCAPSQVSTVDTGRVLSGTMAEGVGRVRRDGGHRVALAGGRRHEHRSALGASIRWPQSDGSGKKTARSAVCWWTNVASPCHSS